MTYQPEILFNHTSIQLPVVPRSAVLHLSSTLQFPRSELCPLFLRNAEMFLWVVQGWICNSSICMTRRGLKPTGIAIYDAQQKGFASVAHYVQVGICSSCAPSVLYS